MKMIYKHDKDVHVGFMIESEKAFKLIEEAGFKSIPIGKITKVRNINNTEYEILLDNAKAIEVEAKPVKVLVEEKKPTKKVVKKKAAKKKSSKKKED